MEYNSRKSYSKAIVDENNLITESDDSNNSFTKSIPVTKTRVLNSNFNYDEDVLTTV